MSGLQDAAASCKPDVDVEISMHQFPVALLSSANSYVQLNN